MADMVDMKRTKAGIKAEKDAMPADDEGQYPYGLCLRLDGDELDKLGIRDLPTVGTECHITAVGKVTATSQSASASSKGSDEHTSMSVQIMFLAVEPEAEEPGEAETAAAENAENRRGVKAPVRPSVAL